MFKHATKSAISDISKLDELLEAFVSQVAQISDFHTLQDHEKQQELFGVLKSMVLLKVVQPDIQAKQDATVDIYQNFTQRKYDDLIFSEIPQMTTELEDIISKDHRAFIQHLFVHCTENTNLDFWLGNPVVHLPEDTWALVVNLGNNIHILRYLKEHRWFEALSSDDKKSLLKRAERFPGEGLEYLKTEFSVSSHVRPSK
jgi:hypothetical protein